MSSSTAPPRNTLPVSSFEVEKAQADAAAKRAGLSLHPSIYIIVWMICSNSTILFNKWLLDRNFPIILTCWHLIFATGLTQVLSRTTSLLDGRHKVKMTGRVYLRAVVPIGVCYCGSLVFSNIVYMYLSVAYIQMLKSVAPCTVLLIGYFLGTQHPTLRTWINVLVITLGVAITSVGELQFSMAGFIYQMLGIIFEGTRLTMIQVLLSGDDFKMDPLVSLYYFAPVCAVMNCTVALFTELPSFKMEDLWQTGIGMLFLNAGVASTLNIASVFLIGKTSSLVLVLAGILKAILLVVLSVIIWGTPIAPLQILGYGIALGGLTVYSLGWDQMKTLTIAGVAYTRAFVSEEGRMSPLMRRSVIVFVSVIVMFFLMSHMFPAGAIPEPGQVSEAAEQAREETSKTARSWFSSFGW
ncbi:putative sugar phosphate/phosphate translocator [Ceratocystis lukuohia]|uniref:Sugar phosphate/phosphate translocator n=1 Tax=Ceratocystis lukuohia TaxID=2019550 RepID=A0ABR4MDB2_9PEZI